VEWTAAIRHLVMEKRGRRETDNRLGQNTKRHSRGLQSLRPKNIQLEQRKPPPMAIDNQKRGKLQQPGSKKETLMEREGRQGSKPHLAGRRKSWGGSP